MTEEKRWISSENMFSAMEELLAEGRQAVFTITGMSMWPFLCHRRDQVVLEHCTPEDLKKGDVVLLRVGQGTYVLHRITHLGDTRLQTTGDGNCHRDPMVPREYAIARATVFIRKGKRMDCKSPFWQFAFRLWSALFPIRGILLGALRKISRVRAFFRRKQAI